MRKISLVILCILSIGAIVDADQVMIGGAGSSYFYSGYFQHPWGGPSENDLDVNFSQSSYVMPTNGTIHRLFVEQTAPSGDGDTATYALNVNDGADSALTCAISGGTDLTCSDVVNSVSVSTGDRVAMTRDTTGDYSMEARFSMLFTPSTADESIITGSSGDSANHQNGYYFTVHSAEETPSSIEYVHAFAIPVSGTLKNMYVWASSDASSDGYTVTIRKNSVATALSCVPSPTCTDSSEVSVSAGDVISGIVSRTAMTVFPNLAVSIVFVPDSSGYSIIPNDYAGGATDRYYNVWSGLADPVALSTTDPSLGQSDTLTAMSINLHATPSAGVSVVHTVYVAGSPTSLSCTISNPDTTCNDTGESITVADGEQLAVYRDTSGTANGYARSGIAHYIAPTGGGGRRMIMN